jgi:hypothetical protein
VLRRVPGRALEQLMHRRCAIERLDLLLAGLVVEPGPPVLDSLDNPVAVLRDLRCRGAAFICGRYVGIVRPVFDAVDGGLKESLADAKNVVAQEPDRAITVVNRALGKSLIGKLQNVALRGAQNDDPFFFQLCRRKRGVPGALQADKFGDVLQVLAEDILATFCQHGHGLYAEPEQLLSSRRIVQNVKVDKVDAFFRKKLFRSKAAASTRLGEQDEFVIYVFHRISDCAEPINRKYVCQTTHHRSIYHEVIHDLTLAHRE